MNFIIKSRMFGFLSLGIPFLIFMMLMMNGCKSEKKISGIDLTNLDTTARPGDDFYQFACGHFFGMQQEVSLFFFGERRAEQFQIRLRRFYFHYFNLFLLLLVLLVLRANHFQNQ